MTPAIRERPVLFSAPMVRAILHGRKTQTRRVVKGHALEWLAPDTFTPAVVALPENGLSPYGYAGDRLWVRETWLADPPINGWPGDIEWSGCGRPISGVPRQYRAPEHCIYAASCGRDASLRWYPSIFMPRWASRILLELTDVRVERLQDIGEDDAIAEGCFDEKEHDGSLPSRIFAELWNSLNAKRGYGWDANPWVWAITFRRIAR